VQHFKPAAFTRPLAQSQLPNFSLNRARRKLKVEIISTILAIELQRPISTTHDTDNDNSHQSFEMASRPTVTILKADGSASGATHPLPKVRPTRFAR